MGEARRKKKYRTEELPCPGKFQPRVSRRELERQRFAREKRALEHEYDQLYREGEQLDREMAQLDREAREVDANMPRPVSIFLFWGLFLFALVMLVVFKLID